MRYEHDPLYNLHHLVPADPSVDFRAFYPYTPNEVKHRRRTTSSQLKVLETIFRVDTKPNATLRNDLAAQLGMTPRGVQVWFQNRRAKEKNKFTKKPQSASGAAAGSTGGSSTDPATPNAELNDEDDTDAGSPPPPTPGEELSEDLSKPDLPSDLLPPQGNPPSFPFPSPSNSHPLTDSTYRSSSAGSWKPFSAAESQDSAAAFSLRPSLVDLLSQRRGSLPANAFFHPYSTSSTSTHGPRSIDAWDPNARRRSVDTSLQRLVMHPYAHLARARNGVLFGQRSPSQAQAAHPHSLSRGKTLPLQLRNNVMPHHPPPSSYLDTRRASMDPRTLMPHRADVSSLSPQPLHPVRASLPDTSLYSATRRYVPQVPGPLPAPNFTFGVATMSSPGSTENDLPSPDFSSYSFPARDDATEDDDVVSVSCLSSFETLSRFGSAVSIATSESSVFSNPGFYGISSSPEELAPDQSRGSCASNHAQLGNVAPGFSEAIPPTQRPAPIGIDGYLDENSTGAPLGLSANLDPPARADTSPRRSVPSLGGGPATLSSAPSAEAPVPSANQLVSVFDAVSGTTSLSSSGSLSPNHLEPAEQKGVSPGHGLSHPQPLSADQPHFISGHRLQTIEDQGAPIFENPFGHKIGVDSTALGNSRPQIPVVAPDQQITLAQLIDERSLHKGISSNNEAPFTTARDLLSSHRDYAMQYANLMDYGFAVPLPLLDDGSTAHVMGKVEGKSDAAGRCGPAANLGANIGIDGFPVSHIVSPTPYVPSLGISNMTTNQRAF